MNSGEINYEYNFNGDTFTNQTDDSTSDQEVRACDDSLDSSNYFSFHGVEKIKVSFVPCDVMWLLAQEYESTEVKAASGQTIYLTVWQDYDDNVTAGDSFTIRGLDEPESNKDQSTILIYRWVSDISKLEDAKQEIVGYVTNLSY